MIVVCPACQARYKFDENKLGDRATARSRCAKCGGSIEIVNPLAGGATIPPGSYGGATIPPSSVDDDPTAVTSSGPGTKKMATRSAAPGSQTMAGVDLHAQGTFTLPPGKRFSLAVIQGAATGQIYQITKTRTTIGRSGSDVNIDDAEASRQHASVEIVGDTAILKDLGSTNGTWIENDRIDQTTLQNQMDFRIGTHVLMFIITDLD